LSNIIKLIITVFIIYTQISFAQTAEVKNTGCEYLNLFDEIEKIKENHVAYHIEIKSKRDAEYRNYIAIFRNKAEKTSGDKCVPVLKEFINFYKDGNLDIGQNPKLSDEEAKKLAANAEKIERSEADIRRKYLERDAKKLDPIQGIWYSSEKDRFAVFRDKKSKSRDFVAFLLSGENDLWEKGHVKAEFKKLNDGSYDDIYYDKKHYPLYPGTNERNRKGGAVIRRNLILHIPPVSWRREYPLSKNPLNKIHSTDPRHPTFQIIDSENILITIPSHRPEYAAVLKEFIENHHKEIINAKNLILDIRGNEGGSSWITDVLMPYIETKEKRPAKYWVGDETLVLSSPRNIGYFKNAEKQG
jgi:hypothetical protein